MSLSIKNNDYSLRQLIEEREILILLKKKLKLVSLRYNRLNEEAVIK